MIKNPLDGVFEEDILVAESVSITLTDLDSMMTLKAVDMTDDMLLDEEGKHVIIRTINGRATPLRVTAEDQAQWYAEQGYPIDPADQDQLWALDDALRNMELAAEIGGIEYQQLYEEAYLESLAEEQQQIAQEYMKADTARKELARRLYDRYLERKAEETGADKEELRAEKQKKLDELRDETGQIPGLQDRKELDDKGWGSVIATFSQENEDTGVVKGSNKWKALKGFDLLLMRALSAVQNGEDISEYTLEDALEDELSDRDTIRSQYARYAEDFGSTSEGYLTLNHALKILEANLDTPAGEKLRRSFEGIVNAMQEDFAPEDTADLEIDSDDFANISEALQRHLPKELPKTFTAQEGKRLVQHVMDPDSGNSTFSHKSRQAARHMLTRLAGLAPEGSFRGEKARAMFESGEGVDKYNNLDVQHKQGWNEAWQDLATKRNISRASILAEMEGEMSRFVEAGDYRPAKVADAMRTIARLQGKLDGLEKIITNASLDPTTGRISSFTNQWDGGSLSGALMQRTAHELTSLSPDAKSPLTRLVPNSVLKIMPDPRAAKQEEASQPEVPAAVKQTLGNDVDTADNEYGFSEVDVGGDFSHYEHSSGFTATPVPYTEALDLLEGDESLMSGTGSNAVVLRKPDGSVVSAAAYTPPATLDEEDTLTAALGEVWEDMDTVLNAERQEAATPPSIDSSSPVNAAFSEITEDQFNSLDTADQERVDLLHEELSRYPTQVGSDVDPKKLRVTSANTPEADVIQIDAFGTMMGLVLQDGELSLNVVSGDDDNLEAHRFTGADIIPALTSTLEGLGISRGAPTAGPDLSEPEGVPTNALDRVRERKAGASAPAEEPLEEPAPPETEDTDITDALLLDEDEPEGAVDTLPEMDLEDVLLLDEDEEATDVATETSDVAEETAEVVPEMDMEDILLLDEEEPVEPPTEPPTDTPTPGEVTQPSLFNAQDDFEERLVTPEGRQAREARAGTAATPESAYEQTIAPGSTGGTFPIFPDQEPPTSGFMVSTMPEKEQTVGRDGFSPESIRAYMDSHIDDSVSRDNYLGTWFNEADNNYYLDISQNVPDRDEAMRLAREHGQLAIYDVNSGEVINVPPEDETTAASAIPEDVTANLSEEARGALSAFEEAGINEFEPEDDGSYLIMAGEGDDEVAAGFSTDEEGNPTLEVFSRGNAIYPRGSMTLSGDTFTRENIERVLRGEPLEEAVSAEAPDEEAEIPAEEPVEATAEESPSEEEAPDEAATNTAPEAQARFPETTFPSPESQSYVNKTLDAVYNNLPVDSASVEGDEMTLTHGDSSVILRFDEGGDLWIEGHTAPVPEDGRLPEFLETGRDIPEEELAKFLTGILGGKAPSNTAINKAKRVVEEAEAPAEPEDEETVEEAPEDEDWGEPDEDDLVDEDEELELDDELGDIRRSTFNLNYISSF